jgi:peptide-methionine (R)-S-oxide reductase
METKTYPFTLSEAEWQKRLTPAQYAVCRRAATEPPGSGELLHHAGDGLYGCAGCGRALFDSKTKYDACGWPSFWDAVAGAVEVRDDLEAVCTNCGSHLGHRFDDGPPPTGHRY